MPWETRVWVPVEKHKPPAGDVDWDEFVAGTAQRPRKPRARYRPGMSVEEIERLEMSFLEQGHFICEKGPERFYYIVAPDIIGASRGQATRITKVRWHDSGAVHGHPITEQELIRELRKRNPEELHNYLERDE